MDAVLTSTAAMIERSDAAVTVLGKQPFRRQQNAGFGLPASAAEDAASSDARRPVCAISLPLDL